MASLVEELKLLQLPAPCKISVEDLDHDLTAARVISKEDLEGDEVTKEIVRSSLRSRTVISLDDGDKRYAGQTISRKDLSELRGSLSEDEDSLEEEAFSGSESGSESKIEPEGTLGDDDVEFYKSGSDEGGVEYSDHSENSVGENEIEEENDDMKEKKEAEGDEEEEGRMIQQFSIPVTDEMEKGKAVVHQIGLWDSLLENRIRIQKSLVQINKLPQHDVFPDFKEKGGTALNEPLDNAQQLLTNLLHDLMVLQQVLLKSNSETAGILESSKQTKHEESDEDIPSDFEDEDEGEGRERDEEKVITKDHKLEEEESSDSLILPKKRKKNMDIDDYSAIITKRHAAFEPFRDRTIKKWNEKTRLASGKISSKSFSSFDRSTLTQIKQILSDKERLIKRTQLKRSAYRVLGKTEDNENRESLEDHDAHLKDYDTEIFDDDDFYHQLLREFIERKSNVDPSDPIAMGRQWLEIQRLRSKVKRKIDTKASKGRRLRYDVHTKLVSFMAPQAKGTMSDSSRNEIFSSLFGKRQPTETADIAIFR